MDIDQARQHEVVGVVEHLVFGRHHGRACARPDVGDALALDHHRLITLGTVVEPGEQLSALDVSTHGPLHRLAGAHRTASAEQHLRRCQQFIRMFECRRMAALPQSRT